MELYELKEKIEDTQNDIEYYKGERERLETKLLPSAINIKPVNVQGGIHDRDRVLLEYAELGMLLDEAISKLDNLTRLRDKKYSTFKNNNSYDKQIYIEKKLFKWKDDKISTRHNGISRSQIFRICKKIEKEWNKMQHYIW